MSVNAVMEANAKWARALSACQRSEYAVVMQRNSEMIRRLLGEVESLVANESPADLRFEHMEAPDRLAAFNRKLGEVLLSGTAPAPLVAERLAELLVLNADVMDALREQVVLLFLELRAEATPGRRLS